jgi:transcriptional regulator with XRE-family HTH domain
MATGKQIKHYREKLGWTLAVLSEVAQVDIGTISALENRDSKKSEFFPALAKAMGLTIEQLADTSTDWPVSDPRAHTQNDPMNGPHHVGEGVPEYDLWLQKAIAELKKIHRLRRVETLSYLEWQASRSPPSDGHGLSVAA